MKYPLVCSWINLVRKALRMESVNLNSFQVWHRPVSLEFIASQCAAEKNMALAVWCECVVKPPGRL